MTRRRKGKAVNGWLVLDKPAGMTSTQAVGAVRRLFDARKAGHAGTLDPLATGILPVALGEATKTVPYAVEGRKDYEFTVRWGAATDTDDAEGCVEILQVPPAFSAVKVDGERAYDLARGGETVELEARPVHIEALALRGCPDRDTAVFAARCSKGTYVRALARDMGRALGCLGHVVALRRTRVGCFGGPQAVGLEELRAAAEEGEAALQRLLRPVEAVLEDLAALSVGHDDAARLLRGQPVLVRGHGLYAPGPAYATCRGRLVAVGRIERGEMHPTRVFNFGESR
jgi:tRNA pseudouridine55 synthase